MNKQQFFDNAVLGIRRQNAPAFYNGVCLYRGVNGTKCAVGQNISDDDYDEDMERSVPELHTSFPTAISCRIAVAIDATTDDDINFAVAMQACHDEAALLLTTADFDFMTEFLAAAERVGKHYGLNLESLTVKL